MKKIISFLSVLFLVLFSFNYKTYASSSDLDKINLFEIDVVTRDDATLDISYSIEWNVLDSTSEGPLSWVKVGVPNKYIDELTKKTSNISSIAYDNSDGAFVRVDLDKDYYAGDVVKFAFSFHQTHMFRIDDEKVYYDYIPGWFNDINVERIVINWCSANVNYITINNNMDLSTVSKDSLTYYTYETSLGHGEKVTVGVNYARSYFPNLNPEDTYSTDAGDDISWIFILVFMGIFLSVVIFSVIAYKRSQDNYYTYRGFSGYHWYMFPHGYRNRRGVGSNGKELVIPNTAGNTSGYHGSGSSCACACACACAGGGRAGCSRKDFYHTNLDSEKIIKNLKK